MRFCSRCYLAAVIKQNDLGARLTAILDGAIDGIISINSDGVIESINASALELFGYNKGELVGEKINALMPKDIASSHDGYIKRYERTRKPRIIGVGRELQGLRKNGETFPFRLSVSEVILHNRVIYTGVIHDISDVQNMQVELKEVNKKLEQKVQKRTEELEEVVNRLLVTNANLTKEVELRMQIAEELKHREADLKEALDKEKELNELKSRFVSMASHEFRTPLTSILSSAALIGKYTDTEQQGKREKHVERIKSAVANLTGVLNDFLSLSKLEEGKVKTNVEPFEVEELINEISEELEPISRNQKLLRRIQEDLPIIHNDKRILKNILFNLLSNAIKYSEDDVQIHVTAHDQMCSISVVDHGVGIPLNEQKHLFSRFFRATNVTNINGTGLGLNIVKRYVNLLEGNISYTSKEGEGSTFKVVFPVRAAQNEDEI